jgi:hypothetical protein
MQCIVLLYLLMLACNLGWPKLQWLVCEQLSKPPKQWSSPPRPSDEAAAYSEVCNTSIDCFRPYSLYWRVKVNVSQCC